MKNKSTRHKDANTFKFQPFAERIDRIDIDIFHRVAHEYETEEEDQCYFYQAVEKWNVLNLTDGYSDFKKEVRYGELITLSQLILHQDRVVDVLKKHLRLKNALCLQPLLELTVAVAQDLRRDFYPYFPDFLEIIIELLNTKDTEQLEYTFQCLAYLFRYAWQCLIKDIGFVLNLILPLLSDSKPDYINRFAAEAFAFVARKVKDRSTFLGHILKFIASKKDGVKGCGKLFFEMVHGVKGQFHSSAETVLPFLFRSLFEDKYPKQVLYDVLLQVIFNIGENIRAQQATLMWKALIDAVTELSQKSKNFENGERIEDLEMILKLIGSALEQGDGKLLTNASPVVTIISHLLRQPSLPESTLKLLTQISILLLVQKRIQLTQEEASSLTRSNLSVSHASVFLFFVDHVTDISLFKALILPAFLKHCFQSNLDGECFRILTKLILKKAPLCGSGIKLDSWTKYTIDFGSKESNQKMENILTNYITMKDLPNIFHNFDDYFCTLVCLPHLKVVDKVKVVEKLCSSVIVLADFITNMDSGDLTKLKRYLFTLNIILETIIHFGDYQFVLDNYDLLKNCLMSHCTKIELVSSLKTLDLILYALKDFGNFINISTLHLLNETLADNFCSPYHEEFCDLIRSGFRQYYFSVRFKERVPYFRYN